MGQFFRGIGDPFITLSEVDSTNNYAMARISEGPVQEGTTWFAWSQTAGKGQRGHLWQSRPGENVTLSVVLKPLNLRCSDQFMLSASIALALRDLVSHYTTQPAKIKWSNDIYIGDKKAGGILIENVIRGSSWSYAIVGIGLNVNQLCFPDDLPNPVSLAGVTGTRHDVLEVARTLCHFLGRRYAALSEEHFTGILSEYTASLYRLGEAQRFRAGTETFTALIRGVETDGRLRVERNGRLVRFDFGEVIFLMEAGGTAT